MAVNKRKVLDTARKFAQKGAKQKALAEYATLLKLDPRDAKLRLEVGDAHRRWNEPEEAIGHYHKVADQYQQDGFDARAVAVHKQILNLDPKRYAAYVALSDLYQRMGLDAEAVGALQTAADGYHKEGKKREALELLRKMAQLDPSNTTSRLKVAELLKQEGLTEDAAEEFEAAAKELTKQGEAGAAEKVYQRLVELSPERTDVLLLMARNAIALRRPERAEGYAKLAVANQKNEETLEVLCDVFKALERTDALIDATKELAHLYRDRGDEDAARTIMQRLPGLDSIGDTSEVGDASELTDHADGRDETDESLVADEERLGDEDFLADDGTDVFELGGEAFGDARDLDLETDDELELDVPAAAPSSAAPSDANNDSYSAAGLPLPEGDPDQLLAEASVYLRYGKTDQAIASLRAVLAEEPGHRAALEKLGEALFESGDSAGAIQMWSNAAERAREEEDFGGFDVLCGRIATLDEAAAIALGPARPAAAEPPSLELSPSDADDALFSDAAVAVVASSVSDDSFADEIEIDFDLDGDVSEAADASAASSSSTANGSSTTTAQHVRGELAEAEFYLEQGMFDEAEAAYGRVLEMAPNHPSALLRIGEIAAARGEDPGNVVNGAADPGVTMRASDTADDDTLSGTAVPPVALEANEALDISIDLDEIEDEIEIDMDLPVDASDVDEIPASPLAGAVSEIEFDIDVESDDASLPPGSSTEDSAAIEPLLGADELAAALAAARSSASVQADETEEVNELEELDDIDVSEEFDAVDVPEPTPAIGSVEEPLTAAADLHADESFDLAAELSGALGFDEDDTNGSSADGSLRGTEEEAFASLFADFKRGVSAALDEGDYETRYDLAIAYREMGLTEDAIAAFQICVPCPKRGLDSLQLMAQCQLDAGRVTDAIGHLEQALSMGGLTPARRAGLYFDLGRAFCDSGDYARARANYETVSELDPTFPGVPDAVADVLERMNDPERARAADAADDDEAFENFDDIVAEATAESVVADLASEVAADVSFESFADIIEEAEDVIDAAAELRAAEQSRAATPDAYELAESEVEEAEFEAVESPPDEPKPKKGRKKISFV